MYSLVLNNLTWNDMFKILFSDLKQGRLLRGPYIGYSLLLTLAMLVFVFATVFSIGVAEHIVGGDLTKAQQQLENWLAGPYILMLIAFSAAYLFASFNIMAKRIRDTGISGWWGTLVIVVIELAVSALITGGIASLIHIAITAAIVFIPSNYFK